MKSKLPFRSLPYTKIIRALQRDAKHKQIDVTFKRKASSVKTKTLSIPVKVPVDLYERYAHIVSEQSARLDQIILASLTLIDEVTRGKLKEATRSDQMLTEYAEIAQHLDLGKAVGDKDHEMRAHYAEIQVASRASRLKTLKVAERS